MLYMQLYLESIGLWLPFFFTITSLPIKASLICSGSPYELNIHSWHRSNFSDPLNWLQEISSKDKSEIGLLYLPNLSFRKDRLFASDNGRKSDRRNNITSSFSVCFLLFAEYILVVSESGNLFRNPLTQHITNWPLFPTDLIANTVFSYGRALIKEVLERESSNEATSNSANDFQVEIVSMVDLRSNQLQPSPVAVYQKKSRHRRSVRSNSNGVPVQLAFEADYGKTVKGREEGFKDHLRKQIAKTIRVPLSSVADMNVRKDRVTADFVLMVTNDHNNVMDETTVQEAASDLQGRIHSGKLKVTDLDSNILRVVAAESIVKASLVSATTDLTPVVLGVVVGVFLLMFVLVILAAIIVQHVNKSCNRSISPYGKRSTYKTFQDDDGRNSINSVGKYSYDSGMWIGPGPEPKRKVPEAPFYRPPTVLQVRETPRPCTAVRVRLKDDWNIDPETTFGSKLEESLQE